MELLPAMPFATDATTLRSNAPRPAEVEGVSRVIPSARLLGGEASVTIAHEGMQYVLRATRAGKLILTK